MIRVNSILKKYEKNGEKSGWVYVEINAEIASLLSPGTKKSFRVKGMIDNLSLENTSLLPVGEGKFILPVNAKMRKAIKKIAGAKITLQLTKDENAPEIYPPLLLCLKDEPAALNNFNALRPSHQRYFSNYIKEAKSASTREKRMASTVNAMLANMSFGEMIRKGRINPDP